MSFDATIQVHSVRFFDRIVAREQLQDRPAFVLIRDMLGRVYRYAVQGSASDALGSACDRFMLCLEPGDTIQARVSLKRCGPLDTEVIRNILSVRLPDIHRAPTDGESVST